MGVITISLNDEVEKKLRKLARVRFNVVKGHLSMAITEAVEEWADKQKEKDVSMGLEILDEGIDMGGMISKNRGDWHRR